MILYVMIFQLYLFGDVPSDPYTLPYSQYAYPQLMTKDDCETVRRTLVPWMMAAAKKKKLPGPGIRAYCAPGGFAL